MANDWSSLFDKILASTDLTDRRISANWRAEYMYFATSIPDAIFERPRPPSFTLNIDASVIFKGERYNDLMLVYSLKPGKGKFVVHIPENVDFNPHRKIEAYYRWVGNLLEIKLQPALSPQALTDLNDDLTQFHLLAERGITRRDLKDREIHIPQMDVRPFYDICTDELRRAINDGSPISVQIFPPGEMVSVGADICFEKGLTGSHLEYCSVHINIANYLAIRPGAPELDVDKTVRVWYRRESNKLKMAFTSPGHPDPELVSFVSFDQTIFIFLTLLFVCLRVYPS
jgi:hypothetical protein